MAEYTPMMQQYLKIKEKNKDSILFYRLGDFYEMFFDDAVLASKELDLVLTGRDCGKEDRAPMCGIPYHSAEGYISRLVQKGYKVSICEQLEDPATAKGIVKRDIIRTISKGTIIEDSMLEDSKNNYICSAYAEDTGIGLCFCDMSTGETNAAECKGKGYLDEAQTEIARFSPSEIILSERLYNEESFVKYIKERTEIVISVCDESFFEYERAKISIEAQFKQSCNMESYLAVCAAGALMSHLHESQKNDLTYINKLVFYNGSSFMSLDANAKKNLEILSSMCTSEKRESLLWVLDSTKTPMGGRLIKKWLSAPLLDIVAIQGRLNAVKNLCEDIIKRDKLIECLKNMPDIERIISRISYGTANCRDLRALCTVCERLPQIKEILLNMQSALLRQTGEGIDDLQDVFSLIDSAISETPPFSVREGGMIKNGFNEDVDHLRALMENSNYALSDIEKREKEATGIKTMKIGYNKVFGYYIEISKGATSQAPLHYVRKQTLSNCERYITEELKILEGEILSSGDRCVSLEYELFSAIRDKVAENAERFQKTAVALASVDVIASFAVVALKNNYSMPEMSVGTRLNITDGRHPIVEAILKDSMFVPNDTLLDCGENRMAIITGPNMAGKSTYMKQVALIVVMAQCGCFVPAKYAEIGICDKIFTRVGASDDLAGGRSTFMVEMTEVADILKNATKNSLLILDEIGRGTSTYDGMAIARAVLEYASDKRLLGAKTMFATHYHELTALEHMTDGVKNYNIVVKKRGDDIIFIKKIVPGGADDSYGVEVAKLAGLPQKVITRAKSILKELESGTKTQEPKENRNDTEEFGQIPIQNSCESEILAELKRITPEVLTPIEALNILNELSKKARA